VSPFSHGGRRFDGSKFVVKEDGSGGGSTSNNGKRISLLSVNRSSANSRNIPPALASFHGAGLHVSGGTPPRRSPGSRVYPPTTAASQSLDKALVKNSAAFEQARAHYAAGFRKIFSPWSLRFRNSKHENNYQHRLRMQTGVRVHTYLHALSLILLVLVSVYMDTGFAANGNFSDAETLYTPFVVAASLLLVLCFVSTKLCYCAIRTSTVVAAADAYWEDEESTRDTHCGLTLPGFFYWITLLLSVFHSLLLVCSFVSSNLGPELLMVCTTRALLSLISVFALSPLAFSHLVAVGAVIVVTFVVGLCVHDSVLDDVPGYGIGVMVCLLLVLLVLLYNRFRVELFSRRTFLLHRLAAKHKKQLKGETKVLRSTVFDMMLHNIQGSTIREDEDNQTVELMSPMEQALRLLKSMQTAKNFPPQYVQAISRITALMVKSFQSDINTHITQNKGSSLNQETFDYLSGLVNQVGGGGRAKTMSMGRKFSLTLDADALSPALNLMSSDNFEPIFAVMEDWNYDVFELDAHPSGYPPLVLMTIALFKKYDFISHFSIDGVQLRNLLMALHRGYDEAKNPYHNSYHAADVARTVYYFLETARLKKRMFSSTDAFCLILAAVMHDFRHPGLSNAFLVSTGDERALMYNDRSVLEQFHVSQAWCTMMEPQNNILANVSLPVFQIIRKTVVDLVLVTDLRQHFAFVSSFRSKLSSSLSLSSGAEVTAENKLTILKMIIKVADIGHSAKRWNLHVKWSERVMDEFCNQGDLEKKAGLKVSPFMDRGNKQLPQAHIGFLEYLVIPLFDAFQQFLGGGTATSLPCFKSLRENLMRWKRLKEAGETGSGSSRAATKTEHKTNGSTASASDVTIEAKTNPSSASDLKT
jgi:hypothetical protein